MRVSAVFSEVKDYRVYVSNVTVEDVIDWAAVNGYDGTCYAAQGVWYDAKHDAVLREDTVVFECSITNVRDGVFRHKLAMFLRDFGERYAFIKSNPYDDSELLPAAELVTRKAGHRND